MSREISADPDWQNVLREWTDVLQPVSLAVIENGLFYQDDETKELESTLRVSLREIDALPIQFFGAIGDLIALLKPEAALWLLPILLRFGSVSEDSIYARSVVNKLRQDIAGLATWSEAKAKISRQSRERLYELALSCCELGWQDNKRVAKRKAECTDILL